MPASIATLNALTVSKVGSLLGSTYQTVSASALPTYSLVTPAALYVTVAAVDDVVDTFFQVERLLEVYPNLITHAIIAFESEKFVELAQECQFQAHRFAIAPNGLILVYVPNVSNSLSSFRVEFPNGYVRG